MAALRLEIEAHPAVNHLFLNRCATSPFAREDYRVFGENHYPLVCVFTSYLERLLVRAPTSDAKLWLAKVLVDEYGEGSEGEDHATLYGHFLRSLRSTVPDEKHGKVPEPALAFVHRAPTHRERGAVPRRARRGRAGARVGDPEDVPLGHPRPPARGGFTEQEIAYFTLHVAQDVDHGRWLEEALTRFGSTHEARQQIRRGAMLSLEARGRFWSGVQRAVVRWRQPRAIRPDGATPRSVLQEVLVTAWDGMPRLPRPRGSLRRAPHPALRPTLHQIVEEGRK